MIAKKAEKVDSIEKLAILMAEGFERIDEQFERIDSRFEKVDSRFDAIEQEARALDRGVGEIIRRLDRLEEQYGYVRGYAKEIDELRSQVNAMQKELDRLSKSRA